MKKALFFAGLAASLLFVGCNKEADFAGNGRPVGITLSDALTRTVNDGLATKWEDGDALNVFYAAAGTEDYSKNTKFTVDDADANHAAGTAELGTGSYDWYLLYPYSSYIKTPANTNSGYLAVGSKSNEKQSQAGLDSKAHLAGANLPVYGVAKGVAADATIEVAMKQVVSVVAVNLTNGTTDPLSVDEVAFTAPEEIIGTFYIDFSGEELAFAGSGASYVSKTAELTVTDATLAAGASAKFYIAVKPFAANAGDKLAVKVKSGESVFEKEITLPSAVKFQSGHIKQINVTYTGGTDVQASSLEAILAMDKDTDILTEEVLVVGKYARGIMLAQNGTYLLAYDAAGVDGAIGDIVTVSGKVGEYSGLKQITSPVVEVVSSGNEVVLPDPKVLADDFDTYESAKVELIQYTGTLSVSGNYYNVAVAGATRKGSIQYPLDTETLGALNGKVITATGFFTGISGSSTKYVNMMSTYVVEAAVNVFDVTPEQINVAATATSTQITVTGNVDWTAEASEGATVDPASGTGNGTITVTFPANTDTEIEKTYSVAVRTTATGVNDEFVVDITQAKAVSGNYFVKVTADADLTDGLYLIVNEKAAVALKDAVDEASNGLAVTISNNAVEATDEVKAIAFAFTASNGAFQGANGKYLAHSGTRNTLNPTDTPSANTVTFSDGNAVITAEDNYFIQYNKSSGQERFRYYKNAQTDGEVQLYKLSDAVTPPPVATLESISLSGQKTEYNVGDTYALDGTVTAHYSDGSTKNVTSSAEVPTPPDMTTAGTKTVTVSYTEGVTKSATYDITVSAAADAISVSEACALADDATANVANAIVAAICTKGFIATDGSKNIYVFQGSQPAVALGDKVNFSAVKTTYYGLPELITVTNMKVVSSDNEIPRTALVDITSTIDTYNSSDTDYITVTGTLEKSGNYYNVTVPGATKYASPMYLYGIDPSALVGQTVVLTGYFNTVHSKGYVQVIATEIKAANPDAKYCSVSPEVLNVAASATSATLAIQANAAWTVTSDNSAFTVSPASGSADATVTISFAANESETAKVANITVACPDASFSKTVVLTQSGKVSGKTDILNQTFTGITGGTYTEFSGKEGASGAVYAGQCAGSNESIQLRSKNNNSGIVTTATGGKVKKVTVTWNSNTMDGRTLNIYGKNEAYTAATDLYDDAKQGTLLGTIVCGTSIELTVTGDYQFLGFRSAADAMYLSEVQVVWQ